MPRFINAGCGYPGHSTLPTLFRNWQEIRIDLDPAVSPDLVASITDLGRVPDGAVDALWSSHCLEHLHIHDVGKALAEFRRVLAPDGFLCLLVPDLQAAARAIIDDQPDLVLYQSPAGPVTPHDMIYGFGPAIARGNFHMAHRSGFTPSSLGQRIVDAGFAEVTMRRRVASFELSAVALKQPAASDARRTQFLADLGF
jgi:ubiquinone/menaquinone biosynthesis C-methylase UbiE